MSMGLGGLVKGGRSEQRLGRTEAGSLYCGGHVGEGVNRTSENGAAVGTKVESGCGPGLYQASRLFPATPGEVARPYSVGEGREKVDPPGAGKEGGGGRRPDDRPPHRPPRFPRAGPIR